MASWAGVPYIKAPPMGKVELTGPSGESMGVVNFKTAPKPPAPPPTIVRFGDVGVAPAGCPMCPVLDKEAVKKQKEELKKNAHRIERLEKKDTVCICMFMYVCGSALVFFRKISSLRRQVGCVFDGRGGRFGGPGAPRCSAVVVSRSLVVLMSKCWSAMVCKFL